MCITGASAWVIIQLYVDPIIRVLTAGFAIIIGYICVKLLGENTVTAYQRAKVSSINIVTTTEPTPSTSQSEKLHTICQDIEIDRKYANWALKLDYYPEVVDNQLWWIRDGRSSEEVSRTIL